VWNVNVQEVAAGKGQLKLYPNPSMGHLVIALDGQAIPANTETRFYNSIGQALPQVSVQRYGDNLYADVSKLPPGVYMCSLLANGQRHTAIFTKQ